MFTQHFFVFHYIVFPPPPPPSLGQLFYRIFLIWGVHLLPEYSVIDVFSEHGVWRNTASVCPHWDINFDHLVETWSGFCSVWLLSFLLQLISNLYGDIAVYFSASLNWLFCCLKHKSSSLIQELINIVGLIADYHRETSKGL